VIGSLGVEGYSRPRSDRVMRYEEPARGGIGRRGWRRRMKGLTADETTLRKLVLSVAATARASSVLPIYQLPAYRSLPGSRFESSLSSSLYGGEEGFA